MSREKLKTLILCILVIMSILFTQRIWLYSPIGILESQASYQDQEVTRVIEARNQLVVPEEAVVSFGSNYYTMASFHTDKVWRESKKVLEDYFLEDPTIRIISDERYREVKQLKSIELNFGESIPSILLSSTFDTLENRIVRDIKEINRVLLPAFNRGVIYVAGEENKAYELKLEEYEENRQLLNFIDDFSRKNHEKYYPLFADVNNDTIMPLSYNTLIPRVFVESQINANDDNAIIEQAKGFFNENLDFVKTIKETSGATIFMYGYGEKGLRINSRGRLEYNEEISSLSSSNVVDSLDVAIGFMLSKQQDLPENLYLKEVRIIQRDGNKGYYFGFGYRVGGLPIAFHTGNMDHPIEIEVYGDQVSAYRSFVREVKEFPGVDVGDTILLPQKIIEDNIPLFKRDYIEDTGEENLQEKEMLHIIEENISNVQIIYYDTLEESSMQLLRPTWKIIIGDRQYYFDGYNGELIHSSPLK